MVTSVTSLPVTPAGFSSLRAVAVLVTTWGLTPATTTYGRLIVQVAPGARLAGRLQATTLPTRAGAVPAQVGARGADREGGGHRVGQGDGVGVRGPAVADRDRVGVGQPVAGDDRREAVVLGHGEGRRARARRSRRSRCRSSGSGSLTALLTVTLIVWVPAGVEAGTV